MDAVLIPVDDSHVRSTLVAMVGWRAKNKFRLILRIRPGIKCRCQGSCQLIRRSLIFVCGCGTSSVRISSNTEIVSIDYLLLRKLLLVDARLTVDGNQLWRSALPLRDLGIALNLNLVVRI